MTLVPRQIRMAMAAIDITVEALAQETKLRPETISRLRTGDSPGRAATHMKLIKVFRARGVQFSMRGDIACVCAPINDE